MELTTGLIKADIIAASQAIDYFEKNNIKDIKNIAAYHLQQAVEKLIKIQIYNCGEKINYQRIYTHDIEALISYAESLDFGFFIPEYIKERNLVITDWEAGSRYDIRFSVRIDVLKKTLSEVYNWYELLYKKGIRRT